MKAISRHFDLCLRASLRALQIRFITRHLFSLPNTQVIGNIVVTRFSSRSENAFWFTVSLSRELQLEIDQGLPNLNTFIMDIVLEIVDTLVLDRIYATLLPANPSSYLSQKFNNATTSTFSSLREGATMAPQPTYVFKPASQYLSLNPTDWAYKSSWPRDNIFRQGISLFFIVW